ncbi:MAG: tRNA guanosine(34) transglycosylase Tgt, partial [Myxococcota bacterium]
MNSGFSLESKTASSKPVVLKTAHGEIPTPTYLPDGTRAVVRTVDAVDLESVGLDALMVNAYHLMKRPGVRRVQHLGGLHRFMGWNRPLVTDSGGFQALSLIRENPKYGRIQANGLLLRDPNNKKSKTHLTPEKAVRNQLRMGSDVVICLDDCTHDADPIAEQRASVKRTIRWAKACRDAFDQALDQRKEDGPPPLLVGVVQGGTSLELRRECAEALMDIGFDAYGFGGWPIDDEGSLHLEVFSLLAEILPPQAPRFALGIGRPDHLCALVSLGGGYVFDCSLPTRDARRYRVFQFTDGPLDGSRDFYRYVY